jgi:hypothetical protein
MVNHARKRWKNKSKSFPSLTAPKALPGSCCGLQMPRKRSREAQRGPDSEYGLKPEISYVTEFCLMLTHEKLTL